MSSIETDILNELEKLKKSKTLEKLVDNINIILSDNKFKNNVDYSIQSRYKSQDSIIEKIHRKEYKNLSNFQDLLGIRIVSKNINSLIEINKILDTKYNILNKDDYYINVKNDGYKAMHIIFEKTNFTFEVQLKDTKNNLISLFNHANIYKNINIAKKDKDTINVEMVKYIGDYYEKILKDINPLTYRFSENEIELFEKHMNETIKKLEDKNINIDKTDVLKNKEEESTKNYEKTISDKENGSKNFDDVEELEL